MKSGTDLREAATGGWWPGACSAPDPMELDRYQYLLLMAGCVLITLPLEFLFGARVWRRPGRLIRSMAVPVALFMAWDFYAVSRDHWGYNPRYVTGWELPGNLPVEELVFFIVIPIASLLTLEAVGRVLRGQVRLPSRKGSERRART